MTLIPFYRLFGAIVLQTILTLQPLSAQDSKTFLYRISGKGLKSPSFLYGTIHLQDSRLFNFQDSLYRYLEQCNTFAMELDPDSITQVLVDKQLSPGKKVLVKDKVSPEALARLKKQYQHMCAEPLESLSLGELLYYVKDYYSRYNERDKMPSFMDMYLMGMAKNQGKTVVGLERVEDQFNLFESLLEGKEPETLLAGMADKRKEADLLVKAYINTDMKAVSKMVSMMPPEIETVLLTNRNHIMLREMEKLMPGGSVFTAVGVAHLPGKDGLIELLRNQGYTVTPELSSARTHAKNYQWKGIEDKNEWETIVAEKDGYSVMMPGEPAKNVVPQTGSDMYTYIGWKTNEYYYSFHYGSPKDLTEDNRKAILTEMLTNSVNNMKGKNATPITETARNGLKGYEVTATGGENIIFRICLLNEGNDIFMLMKGAQKKELLTNENAERFLNSIKMVPKKLVAMERFTDRDLGFSVLFPGTPSRVEDNEEGEEAGRVNFLAKNGNIELLLLVASCNPGYYYINDTLTLGNLKRNLLEKADTGGVEKTGFFQGGYPSWDYSGVTNEGQALQLKYVQRGNRMYFLWIYAPKSTDISSVANEFFSSFELLPYSDPDITMVEKDSIFFATTTGTVDYGKQYGKTDSTSYVVYHKAIASSMLLSSMEIGPMEWSGSDSAYLRNALLKHAMAKEDDLKDESFFMQDGLPAFDAVIKSKLSHQVQKQRMFKKGNTLYLLSMDLEPAVANLASVQTLFNSLKINKQHPPFDLGANSAEKVFAYIDTASVESFRSIIYNFEELPFTRNDLLLLLEKGSHHYAKDTLVYPSLESAIWRKIGKLADSTDISLLEQTWQKLPEDSTSHARSYLLNQLAEIGTNEAMVSLKKLFYPDYEKEPMTGMVFSSISDNPAFIPKFFPDWYTLLDDKRYAFAILHLYNVAKDSNLAIAPPPAGFEDKVLNMGNTKIQQKADEDYESFEMDLIKTLEGFRNSRANEVLNGIALAEGLDEYYRFEAISSLLEIGEEPIKAIEVLAGLPAWRNSILTELEDQHKEDLFPEKYKNQVAMAEAYLYDSFEDENPEQIEAIGTRIATYKGKQYLFYLYKAGYTWDGKTEHYLCVSGPFDPAGKGYKLALEKEWICGMMEEEFNKKRIDKQLASYLQSLEGYSEVETVEE